MVLRHDERRRLLYAKTGALGVVSVELIRTQVNTEPCDEILSLLSCTLDLDEPCSPQGVHKNRVDWVMSVCVARQNIDGGMLSLQYAKESEKFLHLRQDEGAALFLNDRAVYHDMSPIEARDQTRRGTMDMVSEGIDGQGISQVLKHSRRPSFGCYFTCVAAFRRLLK